MGVIVDSKRVIVTTAAQEAMVKAAISVGMLTMGYAQDLCPVGETGNLRNSITFAYSEETNKVELIVGSEQKVIGGTLVNYAPWVELGHHQQPGRFVPKIKKRLKRSWVDGKPFLRPAFENHREEICQLIINALESGE